MDFNWSQFKNDVREINDLLRMWSMENPILPLVCWGFMVVVGLPLAVVANTTLRTEKTKPNYESESVEGF